jgi:hypothetical protein
MSTLGIYELLGEIRFDRLFELCFMLERRKESILNIIAVDGAACLNWGATPWSSVDPMEIVWCEKYFHSHREWPIRFQKYEVINMGMNTEANIWWEMPGIKALMEKSMHPPLVFPNPEWVYTLIDLNLASNRTLND